MTVYKFGYISQLWLILHAEIQATVSLSLSSGWRRRYDSRLISGMLVRINFSHARLSLLQAVSWLGSNRWVHYIAAEGGLEGLFYEWWESEAESNGNCCRYLWWITSLMSSVSLYVRFCWYVWPAQVESWSNEPSPDIITIWNRYWFNSRRPQRSEDDGNRWNGHRRDRQEVEEVR